MLGVFSGVSLLRDQLKLCRAISRDDSVYSEPELFMPERFLTANGQLTDDDITFNFGSVISYLGRTYR